MPLTEHQSRCLRTPSLERRWAGLGPDTPAAVLAALIKDDLRGRFERGERAAVAEYLARFPRLRDDAERVVSLAYEEYCLLEECGERPEPGEFCDRYLPWRESLASQLRYHRLLSQVAPRSRPAAGYPEPGARFGGFLIESVLGRGGMARVYLARDQELGGRLVALKISPDRGPEPAVLGRLDHASVMPALSVTREAATGLRVLCMPYRLGRPLDEVIRRVEFAGRPRDAGALWRASAEGGACARGPGWDGFPDSGCYADAAAWVGLALAGALEHVHRRGFLHSDVKPANVLLAVHEGPQLLDFGLARAPGSAERAGEMLYGGTPPYMAPEQLEAFLAPELWKAVGAAADLYGLGRLLEELMTGLAPEPHDPTLPLPRAIRALLERRSAPPAWRLAGGPQVPEALGAIVARCLAYQPSERYRDARCLAEDLRGYLDRRPGGGVLGPRGGRDRERVMRRGQWGRPRPGA